MQGRKRGNKWKESMFLKIEGEVCVVRREKLIVAMYTKRRTVHAKNPLYTNHRTFHKTFIRRVGRLSVFRIAARCLSVEMLSTDVFRSNGKTFIRRIYLGCHKDVI